MYKKINLTLWTNCDVSNKENFPFPSDVYLVCVSEENCLSKTKTAQNTTDCAALVVAFYNNNIEKNK